MVRLSRASPPILSTMPEANMSSFDSRRVTSWNLSEELPLFKTRIFMRTSKAMKAADPSERHQPISAPCSPNAAAESAAFIFQFG